MSQIDIHLSSDPDEDQMIVAKWKNLDGEDAQAIITLSTFHGKLEVTHIDQNHFQTVWKMVIE